MTRDEALQWCVKHVEEWPEGYIPTIVPNGWIWTTTGHNIWLTNPVLQEVIGHAGFYAFRKMGVVVKLPGKIHFVNVECSFYDPQPDTTPCGQSFGELMREINA